MGRIIPAFSQFFVDGEPMANGWLQFLVSGTNNTDKDTFADASYQIANANPLQLDADGRCPNVFGQGDYRVVSFINDPEVVDTPGEMVQMFDPVTAQGSLSGGGGTGTTFDTWDSLVTYGIGSLVERDLNLYRSLITPNLGLDPLLETYAWEQIDFLGYYNATISYNADALVCYSDNLWLSLSGSNQNNTPDISPEYWRPVASGYKSFINSATDYSISLVDKDTIIVLTPTAPAPTTFTLPIAGASTDLFRVAVYNSSDYNLTVETQGTAGLWLSPTGTITVPKGVLVELIYNSYTDTWLVIGNVGPALGGQDIGTPDNPARTLYIDFVGTATYPIDVLYATSIGTATDPIPEIFATSIGTAADPIPEIFATSIGTISDPCSFVFTLVTSAENFLYVGASQEISMFTSAGESYLYNATGAFYIGTTSANFLVFRTDTTNRWGVTNAGHFQPLATDTYDIGSAANRVRHIYQGDNDVHYLGNSQDMEIFHTGTHAFVESNTGWLVMGTTASNVIYFKTNDVYRWAIAAAGALYPQVAATYDLGTSANEIRNIYQGDSCIHYLGADNDMSLYHTGTVGYLLCSTGILSIGTQIAQPLYFRTNALNRWNVSAIGDFLPNAASTYNIGASAFRVYEVFCVILNESSDIRLKTDIRPSLGLDFVLDLNPVSYLWKDRNDRIRHHGLIAQEVLESLHRCGLSSNDFGAVLTDTESWGLHYSQFIAPLVTAIQELKEIVDGKVDK